MHKEESQKIHSDDPNLLSGALSELRAELGMAEPISYFFRPEHEGDSSITDRPYDYTYNKINNSQFKNMAKVPSQIPQTYIQPNSSSKKTSGYTPTPIQGSEVCYLQKSNISTQSYNYSTPSLQQEISCPKHAEKYPAQYPYFPLQNIGNSETTSWNSNPSNSYMSMGNTYFNYHPYPNSYMPHPQKYQKWQETEGWELATATDSGKKKYSTQITIKNTIEQNISRVVHVKGLEDEAINTEIVASLFSNFGNISKLLFFKKKQTALVEYHDHDSASVAKEMLNNLTFFGAQLKISYSNHASIEENLMSSNNPDKSKDIYTPNPKSYRFKEYKKISINPPSKVLHLSNISKEVYTEKAIADIFAPFAEVKKVRLLTATEEEKCMALIELSTLEDALTCISTLHNKQFFSRYSIVIQQP